MNLEEYRNWSCFADRRAVLQYLWDGIEERRKMLTSNGQYASSGWGFSAMTPMSSATSFVSQLLRHYEQVFYDGDPDWGMTPWRDAAVFRAAGKTVVSLTLEKVGSACGLSVSGGRFVYQNQLQPLGEWVVAIGSAVDMLGVAGTYKVGDVEYGYPAEYYFTNCAADWDTDTMSDTETSRGLERFLSFPWTRLGSAVDICVREGQKWTWGYAEEFMWRYHNMTISNGGMATMHVSCQWRGVCQSKSYSNGSASGSGSTILGDYDCDETVDSGGAVIRDWSTMSAGHGDMLMPLSEGIYRLSTVGDWVGGFTDGTCVVADGGEVFQYFSK